VSRSTSQSSRVLWLAALVAGVLVAQSSCTCGRIEESLFACASDGECEPGFLCVDGTCVPASTLGVPTPDASTPDAGCTVDGGLVELPEASCADDVDNDCDGLKDCEDPSCNAKLCGPLGEKCQGLGCSCAGNGGTPQSVETRCSDGADNDCDGYVDCGDTSCGDGGSGCSEICSDGTDNDGDSNVDCMDPDCQRRQCGPSKTQVCCGLAPSATCVNTASNPNHCGTCGAQCAVGESCAGMTFNNLTTGSCTCSTTSDCPSSGEGISVQQVCALDAFNDLQCGCGGGSSAAKCGTGQTCSFSGGSVSLCYY
jgi:hypothetical protein